MIDTKEQTPVTTLKQPKVTARELATTR